jgi:hypothetical protein
VLEENWDAVQVFQRCSQQYAVGLRGATALGFSAAEVVSACRLYRLATRRWPEISDQVFEMSRIAARVFNDRKP